MARMVWLSLLIACTGKMDGLEHAEADSADPGCEYSVRTEGPEPPHVGDSWELWLLCDGTDAGIMIIQIDPAELGTIDMRTITFLEAGEGQIMAQTGVHRAYTDVTIVP